MSYAEQYESLETNTVFGERVPYDSALAHYLVEGDLWKVADVPGKPWINYSIVNAASSGVNGDVCIVRKNETIPTEQRECWAVVMFYAAQAKWVEITPLAASIECEVGKLDTIHLQIPIVGGPERAHQGDSEVVFSVNRTYHPDGEPVLLVHNKVYSGHREAIEDARFTHCMIEPVQEQLASVIDLVPRIDARKKRDAQGIGQSALDSTIEHVSFLRSQ